MFGVSCHFVNNSYGPTFNGCDGFAVDLADDVIIVFVVYKCIFCLCELYFWTRGHVTLYDRLLLPFTFQPVFFVIVHFSASMCRHLLSFASLCIVYFIVYFLTNPGEDSLSRLLSFSSLERLELGPVGFLLFLTFAWICFLFLLFAFVVFCLFLVCFGSFCCFWFLFCLFVVGFLLFGVSLIFGCCFGDGFLLLLLFVCLFVCLILGGRCCSCYFVVIVVDLIHSLLSLSVIYHINWYPFISRLLLFII